MAPGTPGEGPAVVGPRGAPPDGDGAESIRPEQLGRIAGRALVFQAYLLRRAWGVYYLIWSAALVGFFVVPGVLTGPLAPTTPLELTLYYAYLVGVIALGIWGTSWAFTQSARAEWLRDSLEGRSRSRRRFLQILWIGLGITALVTAVSYVSNFYGLLVLDAALGTIILWLLIQIRAWFHPPPPEAALAIGTYATSVVASAIALVLTGDQALYSAFWLVATVGWAFAGVYALYHAPEEMTPDARA